MFNSIKEALQKNSAQTSGRNILKFEKDKTYTVRLIPNISNPVKTFFHYYTYDWTSYGNGQYTTALSPATFGQKCVITDTKYRLLRNGSDEEKQKADLLRRNERWLVNVYVVDDPTNPDNNGNIKIMRYGKQLHKIISDAIDGEGSEDYGARIFDLSENGVNLKVKCEQQGDYITYVSSKFTLPRKIEGIDDTKAEKIYNSVFDLESIVPTKSNEELVALLDEHFFARPTLLSEKKVVSLPQEEVGSINSNIVDNQKVTTLESLDDDEDENLKKLIAELE